MPHRLLRTAFETRRKGCAGREDTACRTPYQQPICRCTHDHRTPVISDTTHHGLKTVWRGDLWLLGAATGVSSCQPTYLPHSLAFFAFRACTCAQYSRMCLTKAANFHFRDAVVFQSSLQAPEHLSTTEYVMGAEHGHKTGMALTSSFSTARTVEDRLRAASPPPAVTPSCFLLCASVAPALGQLLLLLLFCSVAWFGLLVACFGRVVLVWSW